MDVRVLGEILAVTDRSLALGGPTQRRVLAALALRRNEVVSVRYLVDVIWPEATAPERAEHNVRTYVHRLRTSLDGLGDRVETVGAGYRLRLDPDELDAARFEQLAGTAARLADTGDPVAALDVIDEAEALWRGTPVEEFEHEAWAVPDVVRLRELHSGLRARRAATLIDAGRPADAVALLEALVRQEPLRERPRALLMRALYESGRQTEALRAFQEFRRLLVDEVGVEPSGDLVALDRGIATGTLSPSGGRIRSVGGYELHERIGEGAFAVVHRATQSMLGREVAVKVIRAELANRPEFIRRFEAEAQMVARVEHPNVVPLYDYWREPDRAFLVMRWMTGGSLESRLDDGPWPLEATLDLVDQLASALGAAHDVGVVHRDVKPANILFDAEGRAYLGDFGVALGAEGRSRPEAALSEGSPVFASPEQLRREPAGPEADVHALAIVAFTLLTGRTPFADARDQAALVQRQLNDPIPPARSSRPDLPEQVDQVLAVATAKRASDRYPTARAFALALRTAAASEGAAAAIGAPCRPRTNPYKGLRAFDETDASYFHGRERLVGELLADLAEPDHNLLAVVGPSGSGKSSVVRAGLIPALRDGRAPGSSQWFITTTIPGTHPFEALETALLRIAVNPPGALLAQLCDGERGVLRGIKRILPDDQTIVAVVIDQFEELFTGGVPDGECDRFLRALTVAATEPGSPVRFVLTLRADFYDRPLRHPDFAPLLKEHTVAVTPLAPDELEHAIVTPAAAVGVGFEPGLVAEIIADVNHEPGTLPLLQYALTQAFDQTDGDTITIDSYRSIGGLAGALGRRAEDLWQSADDSERAAIRHIFGRLVTLGEGSEDTRRRVHLAELGEDPATRAAVERYGHARLLTFDRDHTTREPTVELAHEALIREWPRLREWLDDDRDTLRTHRHLTAAAQGWIDSDRDPNELYRGARLENAEQLLRTNAVTLNHDETEFLTTSSQRKIDEAAAERRRVRRLHRLVAATAIVAALALTAGAIAYWQQQRAEEVAYDAETARLVATAESLASTKPHEAMLLAVTAHQRERSPATLGALHATLSQASPVLGYLGWGNAYVDVEWLPSSRIVGVRADGLDVFDGDSAELVDSADLDIGHGLFAPASQRLRASAGGSDLLAVAAGTTVHVFSVADRLQQRFEKTMPGPVTSVEVTSDGRIVVATSLDGTVTGWTAAGDEAFPSIEVALTDNLAAQFDAHTGPPLDFPNPDLRGFFAGAPVWVSTVAHPDHIHLQVGASTFSIDYEGRTLTEPVFTYVDVDGSGLLPAATRQVLHPQAEDTEETVLVGPYSIGRLASDPGPAAPVPLALASETFGAGNHGIVYTFLGRDGRPISLLDDGTLVRFDPDTGARLASRDLGTGSARSAVAGPDPGTLAIASERGITLTSADGAGPLTIAVPRTPVQSQLSLSHNGRFVVLAGGGATAVPHSVHERRADQRGYRPRTDFPIAEAVWAGAVPTHPEVDALGVWGPAVGDAEIRQTMSVFRLDTNDAPSLDYVAHVAGLNAGDLDPRWRWLVASVVTGVIQVYDVQADEMVAQLPMPPGTTPPRRASGIRFHPSGDRLLVASSTGQFQLYDTETWAPVDEEALAEHDIALGYWNDDGSLLATASSTGQITVRHGDTFEPIRDMVVGTFSGAIGGGNGTPLLFSPDDTLLLTDHDNVARLWDVATGQQIGIDMSTADGTNGSINTGDALQLITGTEDGALIWNLDTQSWADVACRTAGSNLTEAEWEQWGPRDEDHRAICDRFPLET